LFKDRDNFAGQTTFVGPELVRGTLLKGFDFYKVINSRVGKALYMMFLISEVHPFLDGNGRIARVMMNAELVAAGESKIMIPTVYRDDYIGALRRLTRRDDPDAYIRMMERAHEFSENVYGDDRDEMEAYLQSCNAFLEDTEGKILKIVPRTVW
jgi:Fic family protein